MISVALVLLLGGAEGSAREAGAFLGVDVAHRSPKVLDPKRGAKATISGSLNT
ncbi:hypothetical protein M758_10G135100 [Ceratodon purpureus]|nr:hypothetical protein M758_10G135100 [Ceratodon purpureus]